MTTVSQILQAKGNQVWTITPAATVYEALALMAEHGIGALVVVEDGAVVGILSERDYARKVVLQGKSSRDTPVRDVMSSQVVCVRPSQTLDQCMAVMTNKRIRHLPVLDQGRLAGVVSIGDVVKAIITEQSIMIDHLKDYIISG
jgi:CBS domain-containing protein